MVGCRVVALRSPPMTTTASDRPPDRPIRAVGGPGRSGACRPWCTAEDRWSGRMVGCRCRSRGGSSRSRRGRRRATPDDVGRAERAGEAVPLRCEHLVGREHDLAVEPLVVVVADRVPPRRRWAGAAASGVRPTAGSPPGGRPPRGSSRAASWPTNKPTRPGRRTGRCREAQAIPWRMFWLTYPEGFEEAVAPVVVPLPSEHAARSNTATSNTATSAVRAGMTRRHICRFTTGCGPPRRTPRRPSEADLRRRRPHDEPRPTCRSTGAPPWTARRSSRESGGRGRGVSVTSTRPSTASRTRQGRIGSSQSYVQSSSSPILCSRPSMHQAVLGVAGALGPLAAELQPDDSPSAGDPRRRPVPPVRVGPARLGPRRARAQRRGSPSRTSSVSPTRTVPVTAGCSAWT